MNKLFSKEETNAKTIRENSRIQRVQVQQLRGFVNVIYTVAEK